MLHVSCAADERYLAHSAAMLHSVLAHRQGHAVQVHYLHGPDLPPDSARRLASMVQANGGSISFLEVPDERVAGLPTLDFISSPMWYRIFLPELLPDVERILYLDVDTIVTDSLAPLWDIDLEDNYLAAVSNVFQLDHLHRPVELGLDRPQDYFNSGVLLLNLDEMRRDGCTSALRDYAFAHAAELRWPDQDTLNVVLGARRRRLHPRWNCMNSVLSFPWSVYVFGDAAVREARRRPAIRHFEGPDSNKPWHYLCQQDLRELYSEHRRQTPWPSHRAEGVTARNILRRARRAAAFRLSA